MTVLLEVNRHWECPNCSTVDVTHEAGPHVRYHTCPGLMGLTAPMIPSGTKAKVFTVEREDYIGDEDVPMQNERPVMAVITVREDGQDAIVFAPTAHGVGVAQ